MMLACCPALPPIPESRPKNDSHALPAVWHPLGAAGLTPVASSSVDESNMLHRTMEFIVKCSRQSGRTGGAARKMKFGT